MNGMTMVNIYIYPLSISKLREGYMHFPSAFHFCLWVRWPIIQWFSDQWTSIHLKRNMVTFCLHVLCPLCQSAKSSNINTIITLRYAALRCSRKAFIMLLLYFIYAHFHVHNTFQCLQEKFTGFYICSRDYTAASTIVFFTAYCTRCIDSSVNRLVTDWLLPNHPLLTWVEAYIIISISSLGELGSGTLHSWNVILKGPPVCHPCHLQPSPTPHPLVWLHHATLNSQLYRTLYRCK